MRNFKVGISRKPKNNCLETPILRRDFDNLKIEENESVHDFSSRVLEIVNQIKRCGDTIQEKRDVEKIFQSLPAKFDHVVAATEESKDLSKMTMYELTRSFLAHEQRFNHSASQSIKQVFQTKQAPKSSSSNQAESNEGSNHKREKYGKCRQNE